MGWESRSYGRDVGGGGRFREVLRRIFGDGENPLDWSLPLYTAWGIRVRIHLLFVVVIIVQLIWSIPRSNGGWPFMLIGMTTLFVLVLLHEYGHCFACRMVGGSADRILMWPLGGLASCHPPHDWRSSLITTAGGPAVNAALLPVLGGAMWALAGLGAVFFNPFEPQNVLVSLRYRDGTLSYWLVALWWAYYLNLILLAFNVLVPMYPMDGGRMLQEILWRRIGYRRATSIAATVGLAVAGVMFVVAMTGGETTLLAIALFGGVYCWMEKRRLSLIAGEDAGVGGYDFSRGYSSLPGEDSEGSQGADDRRLKRERQDQERLDAILAKIARTGMDSLSWRERRWLRRQTQRRRAR